MKCLALALALTLASLPALADNALDIPDYQAPAPQMLTARTLKTFDAPEADQGVAVDGDHFYAIDNSIIARYDREDGRLTGRFIGPNHGLIRHLNSCFAEEGRLLCANSNYSLTPMGSSVEIFDAKSLKHVGTHSLGMMDEGSLTWFDHYEDGWMAGFAHYDENGGLAFKDHRFSSVVTFDDQWRRTGGWLFPEDVIERMAPHAASGGAIGPDGLLYVLGHDRPEMYVLAKPAMGPTMLHVATIALEAEGQAFSFVPDGGRDIFTVDRHNGRVRQIRLPEVKLTDPDARRFRD